MTLLLVVTLICYVSVQFPGVLFVFRMYGRKINGKIRAQINLLQARCVNLFVHLLISCTGAPTRLNCFTTLNALELSSTEIQVDVYVTPPFMKSVC